MRLYVSPLRFALIVALVTILALNASAVVFDDGLTHVVDVGNSFPLEGVVVDDGPGAATTTLQVMPGGEIGTIFEDNLEAFGSSQVTIVGGTFGYSIELHDTTNLVMSGGSAFNLLLVQDAATATFSGGTVNAIVSGNQSTVVVSGGVIGSFNTVGHQSTFFGGEVRGTFAVNGKSLVEVFDVNVSCPRPECNLTVSDEGFLEFWGGNVESDFVTQHTGEAILSGGTIAGSLFALDQSVITIRGSGFNFQMGDIAATSGTLTGFLLDGTPINNPFGRASTATITLPEPSALTALGSGIAMLALLYRRRGRRRVPLGIEVRP